MLLLLGAVGAPLTPDELTTRGLREAREASANVPVSAAGLPEGVLDPGRYDLPIRYNAEVAKWVAIYTGRGRAAFARKLARKGRYEAVIREALRRHGLPQDLEWLVLVESGFRATAVSRANAVGMWQFLLPTAGDYGLRVDRWVDERRDPAAASEAGCRLLADLHGRFGSWELAMAAFNAGIGYVTEAVRRYNSNDFWTIARYDYLPAKSAQYVGMVLAATMVGENPAAFGFGPVVPETPPEVVAVSIAGGVRLSTLAKAAGVDVQTLEKLNPALRKARTPRGDDRWSVWIPAEAEHRFTERYDRIRKKRARYKRVMVRYGETVQTLAKAYGVSVRALRTLNGLGRSDDPTGQELVVPVSKSRQPKAPPAPEEGKAPVVVLPKITFDYGPDRPAVLFRVPRRSPADAPLAGLAGHFGVSRSDVALWNGLDSGARVQRGMILRIFPSAARSADLASAGSDTVLVDPKHVRIVVADSDEHADALAAAALAREEAKGVRRKKQTGFRRHTVKRGETLARIARRYRTTAESLRQLNKIDPRRLKPGQVLRVRRGDR